MSTRFEKYWTESGRGDGQGDVEKKDHQSYRRPYIMGKARGNGIKIFFYKHIHNIGPMCASPWVLNGLHVSSSSSSSLLFPLLCGVDHEGLQ